MCTHLDAESTLPDRLSMHLWLVVHICELIIILELTLRNWRVNSRIQRLKSA